MSFSGYKLDLIQVFWSGCWANIGKKFECLLLFGKTEKLREIMFLQKNAFIVLPHINWHIQIRTQFADIWGWGWALPPNGLLLESVNLSGSELSQSINSLFSQHINSLIYPELDLNMGPNRLSKFVFETWQIKTASCPASCNMNCNKSFDPEQYTILRRDSIHRSPGLFLQLNARN